MHFNTGRKASEETKLKMSIAQTGRTHSVETREKMRRSMMGKNVGKIRSPELIERFRKLATGRKHTTETKLKMSAWQIGRKRPQSFCENMRKAHRRRKEFGRYTNGNGYVLVFSPGHPATTRHTVPYVSEHRLVMEKHIGRFLTREEVIHHINGIRSDNRIENLFLCKSNSEHTRIHQKRKICSLENCGNLHIAKGLCGKHYQQNRVKIMRQLITP